MESHEEVVIPFNRRALCGLFLLTLLLSLSGVGMVTLFGSEVALGMPPMGIAWRCVSGAFLVLMCLSYAFMALWALHLGRCLRGQWPAFVFRRDGIVDNASPYWVGLVRWTEMARIYPCDYRPADYARPRLPARLRVRLPRRRVVVIVFKAAPAFRSRLPWLKALALRVERYPGALLVGEGLLGVPADEFIRSLNRYYVERVRRDGLP